MENTTITERIEKQVLRSKLRNTIKLCIIIFIFAVIFLVSGVVVTKKFIESDREAVILKMKIQTAKNVIDVLTEEKENIEYVKERAITELEEIKDRVEKIKTLDDLLERDIKLYIKTHYRKVPVQIAVEVARNVIKFGKKYRIPPILIIGIMQVESGFNPMITGPDTKYGNARGLMQVMPEWVQKLGLKSVYDLYDIDTNIESGCKVFNIHLKEGQGKISEGLYLYVNKDKQYVTDVFTAMGKFVAFRSTVKPDKEPAPENGKDEDESNQRTEDSPKRDNEPAESK